MFRSLDQDHFPGFFCSISVMRRALDSWNIATHSLKLQSCGRWEMKLQVYWRQDGIVSSQMGLTMFLRRGLCILSECGTYDSLYQLCLKYNGQNDVELSVPKETLLACLSYTQISSTLHCDLHLWHVRLVILLIQVDIIIPWLCMGMQLPCEAPWRSILFGFQKLIWKKEVAI